MTTEPNNEQARELSEKELEGIAGGTKTFNLGMVDLIDATHGTHYGDKPDAGLPAGVTEYLPGSGLCVTVT